MPCKLCRPPCSFSVLHSCFWCSGFVPPATTTLSPGLTELWEAHRTGRNASDLVVDLSQTVLSDVLALAWPESHGFGLALPGFGLANSEARPKAKAKPTLALA
ncbi:hypothetical protein C8R46DRAFT_1037845 [Mycena filopes]|nr:hypothetical protein C8R46DRAFT_1037845 [Mycena filopes]